MSEEIDEMVTFLKARYPEPKTLDKVWDYLSERISVIEDVYFEVGILAGAQLGFELRGRMEELR